MLSGSMTRNPRDSVAAFKYAVNSWSYSSATDTEYFVVASCRLPETARSMPGDFCAELGAHKAVNQVCIDQQHQCNETP